MVTEKKKKKRKQNWDEIKAFLIILMEIKRKVTLCVERPVLFNLGFTCFVLLDWQKTRTPKGVRSLNPQGCGV